MKVYLKIVLTSVFMFFSFVYFYSFLVGAKNEGKNWNYINYKLKGLRVYFLGVYDKRKGG